MTTSGAVESVPMDSIYQGMESRRHTQFPSQNSCHHVPKYRADADRSAVRARKDPQRKKLEK